MPCTDDHDIGGIQGKSPASGPKGGNDENLVHSIKGMSIGADAPKIKQKNLDVASEYARTKAKNAANFVVIGLLLPATRRK